MGLLAWLGTRWVARQRERHRPGAGWLPTDALAALAPFFPSDTLGAVRVAVVPRIPSPAILGLARRLGLAALDFDRVLAITFADTIVVTARTTGQELLATLFHELVHVEQVQQLGLRGFVQRYANEWWQAGRRYHAIPMERDAYALQQRFEAAPREAFDVAVEVARRLVAKGLDVPPAG